MQKIKELHSEKKKKKKNGKSNRLYFLGLQNRWMVDDDCSHEIKKCLLLGRKAMSNLDSLLKSRYVTLLTKVRLVKAMVFPVVTYECESTQEWMLLNCAVGEDC